MRYEASGKIVELENDRQTDETIDEIGYEF